jgi:hypothetical protein
VYYQELEDPPLSAKTVHHLGIVLQAEDNDSNSDKVNDFAKLRATWILFHLFDHNRIIRTNLHPYFQSIVNYSLLPRLPPAK